mmetsp:Transcript_40452/g.35694  ORF Transcript_40452/g.35694 Transcript_40452/m.35694 type:complete len:392 (-) Transcript_40452:238-1413(-)
MAATDSEDEESVEQKLINAIYADDLDEFRLILLDDPDFYKRDAYLKKGAEKVTPLHVAVMKKKVKFVEAIIKYVEKCNKDNAEQKIAELIDIPSFPKNNTVVHLAAQYAQAHILKILLYSNYDVEVEERHKAQAMADFERQDKKKGKKKKKPKKKKKKADDDDDEEKEDLSITGFKVRPGVRAPTLDGEKCKGCPEQKPMNVIGAKVKQKDKGYDFEDLKAECDIVLMEVTMTKNDEIQSEVNKKAQDGLAGLGLLHSEVNKKLGKIIKQKAKNDEAPLSGLEQIKSVKANNYKAFKSKHKKSVNDYLNSKMGIINANKKKGKDAKKFTVYIWEDKDDSRMYFKFCNIPPFQKELLKIHLQTAPGKALMLTDESNPPLGVKWKKEPKIKKK